MKDFAERLAWSPVVERPASVAGEHILVGGMGGSALGGHALKYVRPDLAVTVHESYDLPVGVPEGTECIAISYSGNTEESLSFAQGALAAGLPLACVASGGTLADLATEKSLPLVRVPAGLAPRNALPYMLRAVMALRGLSGELAAMTTLSLDGSKVDLEAARIAAVLKGKIPILYAADAALPVTRVWLTMLTETAKIPSFQSIVPGSNHYEVQSYDTEGPNASLAKTLLPLFFRDSTANTRSEHRLDVLDGILSELGYRTDSVIVEGNTQIEKIIYAWALSVETATLVAEQAGVSPDRQHLTDLFKKRL